jgi:hypothetical protein
MNVRGKVAVTLNNNKLLLVTGNTVGFPLLPPGGTTTGGTGSYIDSILVFSALVTTVGSTAISLADNTTGTVQIFPSQWAPTTTMMNTLQYQIFLGMTSEFGPWRLTLGGGVNVVAVGRFEK